MKKIRDLSKVSTRLKKAAFIAISTLVLVFAFSSKVRADILVTVRQFDVAPKQNYQIYCDIIYSGLNVAKPYDVTCLKSDPKAMVDPRVNYAKNTGQFNYHIEIHEKGDGASILIRNWLKTDSLEVDSSDYELKIDDKNLWQQALHKLAKNLADYDQNKDILKETLLAGVISDSQQVRLDDKGNFIDIATGETLSSPQAWAKYKNESPRTKNNLRAGLQLTAALGFGLAVYLKDASNVADWEYGFKDGLQKKLRGDAIRFDNNRKHINTGHAFAGMTYHLIARANGYSAAESFLFNAAASAIWEFIVEYREILSINDKGLTVLGGTVIGEAIYQTYSAWNEITNCRGDKIMKGISDFVTKLEVARPLGMKKLTCGMSSENRLAEMSLSTGYVSIDGKGSVPLAFNSAILNVPTDTNKNLKLIIPDVYYSKIHAQTDNITDPLESFHFITQIAYAAIYKQKLEEDTSGQLNGYQLILSPTSRYEMRDRKYDGKDFFASVNIIGPRAQVIGYVSGFKINLVLEIYKDFAMVSSYALSQYDETNTREGLPFIVQQQSYYYAQGETARAEFTINKGKWAAGAEVQNSSYDSIGGHDRYQELVTKDLKFKDRYSTRRFFIEYSLTDRIALELSVEKIKRSGFIEGGYSRASTEKRTMGQIKYKF